MRKILSLLFYGLLISSSNAIGKEKINPYNNHFGSESTICPSNGYCQDGTNNFLCADEPYKPAPHCNRFHLVPITRKIRLNMVHAHNGMRNKVAQDFNIANMNLVYWNIQLQRMAEQYLSLCRVKQDTCLVVGANGVSVGQNTAFLNTRAATPHRYWAGRAVRTWYLEIGQHIKNFEEFLDEHKRGTLRNFTQLIWPKVEFIGCAGAIMSHGFFVVCYYYPPVLDQNIASQFIISNHKEACICPPDRIMCSKLFTNLCGYDLHMDDGGCTCLMSILLFIISLLRPVYTCHLFSI